MAAQSAVDQPQVLDGFYAVSLHSYGLQLVFLCFLLLFLNETAVTLVHQCFCVVAVRLDG